MQTIVRQGSNVSLYLFSDSESVSIQTDKLEVGDPVRFIVADCDSSNVTLHQGVTEPADWCGNKYVYTTDDGWQSNPDFIASED